MLQNEEESNVDVEQRDDTDTQGRGDGEAPCVYCDMICILLCTDLLTYVSIDIAGAGTDSQSSLDMSFTRHQCPSGGCAACPQAATAVETTAVTNASTEASVANGKIVCWICIMSYCLSTSKSNICIFVSIISYHIKQDYLLKWTVIYVKISSTSLRNVAVMIVTIKYVQIIYVAPVNRVNIVVTAKKRRVSCQHHRKWMLMRMIQVVKKLRRKRTKIYSKI